MCGGSSGGNPSGGDTSGGPSVGQAGPGSFGGHNTPGGALGGMAGPGSGVGGNQSGNSAIGNFLNAFADRNRKEFSFGKEDEPGRQAGPSFGEIADAIALATQAPPRSVPTFELPDLLPLFSQAPAALPGSFGTSPAFTQGGQGAALQPIGLPEVTAVTNPGSPSAPLATGFASGVINKALGTLANAQQSGVNLGF